MANKKLNDYRLLGKTGLRVSPLSLGTMTFGEDWGWGASKESAKEIFQTFVEAGGNLIDTADLYTGGKSEEFIGEFTKEMNVRDHVVIATKFSYNTQPGNPNAGGNGRKNIIRAVEGSLKRLGTDYIDLLFLHTYDMLTPVEEVMSTLNDLVRQGKVLHIGLSDVPAWYASRAQTIAELKGYEPISALQMEYSLVSRSLEREHAPLAKELGISLMPWSPLASGVLTGKYSLDENGKIQGEGRMAAVENSGNPVFEKFYTKRNFKIVETLKEVASELGRTPAEVAISFVANRPQVATTLISGTKVSQLQSNINALEIEIPEELNQRLLDVSRIESNELDDFFTPELQAGINGGTKIRK